jgi:hypothetical protein
MEHLSLVGECQSLKGLLLWEGFGEAVEEGDEIGIVGVRWFKVGGVRRFRGERALVVRDCPLKVGELSQFGAVVCCTGDLSGIRGGCGLVFDQGFHSFVPEVQVDFCSQAFIFWAAGVVALGSGLAGAGGGFGTTGSGIEVTIDFGVVFTDLVHEVAGVFDRFGRVGSPGGEVGRRR